MLQIIRSLLQQIINDIDSNNSNISERQQFEVMRVGFKELSWNKSDLDEFLEKEK